MGELLLQLTCKQQRISIILLIISFLLLGISLIITWMNPADKYEVSIFRSTPIIYWVALLLSLFIGFVVLINNCLSLEQNKLESKSALILVVIAYTSFLALWIIRGYYLWCSGDPLTHLGKIKDVLALGHIDEQNLYPITHILLAEVAKLLNMDIVLLHKYTPLCFSIFFILFMVLFVKSVLPNKNIAIFVFLVSVIPLHGYYLNLTPNHLSNLYLPLAFYIFMQYINIKGYQWCILFFIMVLLFPVFHPVSSLALLIMVTCLTPPVVTVVKRLCGKFLKLKQATGNRTIVLTSLILFIWITIWVSSFGVWDSTINNIYTLITEGSNTQLESLVGDIRYAQTYGYSVIKQFLKIYGGLLIFLVLTIISCALIWEKIKQKKSVFLYYQRLIALIIPLLLVILIMGILYFTNIGFGAKRLETYIVVLSMPFVGYSLMECVNRASNIRNKFHIRTILTSIFLVFVFVVAGLKLYPSPYTLSNNRQITITEAKGMNWLLYKRDNKLDITSLTISTARYADAFLTKDERSKAKVYYSISDNLKLPYHFGYGENMSLGEHYEKNVYMVLTYRDRIVYQETLPDMAYLRYTNDDFYKLEKDHSVFKFYENGGLNNYHIYSNLKNTSL